MSAKEWTRKQVLERHKQGRITTVLAAKQLQLSTRQVRRLAATYDGQVAGVRHGNSGRAPSNKTPDDTVTSLLSLVKKDFVGFNDTHFVECVSDEHGIQVARSTWQRIARAAGVKAVRKRRSRRYRQRREREGQRGKMLLWDGSFHNWLEERGPKLCLIAAIDDASGEVLSGAHFLPQESAAGYLRVLAGAVQSEGIPCSIYMDRHGSLKRNDGYWTIEEELKGEQTPTHVGQALRELGIECIFALSPQAKGRVERLWGTLQDRLVSEMRRRRISSLDDANTFLTSYLTKFNARFGKPPKDKASAFRPIPPQLKVQDVCSFRYKAVVSNDNLVVIDGIRIQIPRPDGGRSFAKANVDVRQHLDGRWRVFHKGECIADQVVGGVANEVRPRKARRRSAAANAFRKAVRTIELPKPKTAKALPAPKPSLRPFNHWTKREKLRAAKKSKVLREQRPKSW